MAIEPDIQPVVDRGEGIIAMQPMKIGEGARAFVTRSTSRWS